MVDGQTVVVSRTVKNHFTDSNKGKERYSRKLSETQVNIES